jgi:1,2-diacylglycerol 3-beta-glucosyltransferase
VAAVIWPFEGLAAPLQVFFALALLVIVVLFVWTATLFLRGRHAAADAPAAGDPDDFHWIFFVPALNEEVTIRDSVERLLAIEVAHRTIIVIDDGSDDGTAEVLGRIEHPDLFTPHRVAPHAREGKAEALNYAYRRLAGVHGSREKMIVVVVDADGRLSADAPRYAAAHFEDPEVGGVQSLVRIYNRSRLLTWFQDLEFATYGRLFQAGRNHLGTAGMGGNGQFNRLSALDAIATEKGPWRDRLTEDQDVGLRLVAAGWDCRQELRAAVDQQGLPQLRPLFRQRTRWSQGNLQAIGLAGEVARAPVSRGARAELLLYLLMPLWQGFVGLALLVALALALFDVASFWGGGPWWQLVFFYLLCFGGTMFGCIAARAQEGPLGWLKGLALAQPYAFYSWLLWPVLLRSAARQLTERRDWTKTEREAQPGAHPV